MRRFTLLFFLFGALLITLPQLAFAGAYEPDRSGATIYRANCASCHGYDGTGGTNGYASFVNENPGFNIQGQSAGTVKKFIRSGRGIVMPGFNVEEISENEKNTVAACIDNETCQGSSIYPDPAYQHNVRVLDEDPWFDPYTLAVPTLPATVRFVNHGQTWHTVTEATFLTNASNPANSNSGLFGRGGKFFVTYTTPGTFKYYCMLHPFMQIQVCAGSGTCNPPTAPSPSPTMGLPANPGVGELWVAVQGINVPGKPFDPGAAVAPYPDLRDPVPDGDDDFDNFVKDGEIQVINLTNYTVQHVPSNAANNTMNNPHYIWGRAGSTEMVVTNYLDNYYTMFNASNKAVTVPRFYWGATTSHVTGEFDGNPLWGPVQGDYGVQVLKPGRNVGSWSIGTLTRISTSDTSNHTGSMPHGIWAGGSGGTTYLTANSRTNNTTVFSGNNQATCTMGPFPLNPGITVTSGAPPTDPYDQNGGTTYPGLTIATTNVTNPTTSPSSLSVRLGRSGTNPCGTSGEVRVPLLGSGPVQTPPSPDDRFLAVSNGPYISVVDLWQNFPTGSTCAGSTTFRVAAGFRICDINESVYGAHGVAWGRKSGDPLPPNHTGWRIYMPGKFVDFVSVTEVNFLGSPVTGAVAISHVGDIPLAKYAGGTCTRRALAGCTDTVPQGVTTVPLPTPWQ